MAKTQAPRVVDRRASRRLQMETRWGAAFEAVLSLFILNGGLPFDRYERGPELTRMVRGMLPASVERAVNRLRTPAGDPWSALLGMLAVAEPPHDVLTVLDRLLRLDPVELKLAMLGSHTRGSEARRELSAAVFEGAAAGHRTETADLLQAGKAGGWDAEVAPVLQITARELTALVVGAIRDLPSELYLGNLSPELLESNAGEADRLLAEADDAEGVIEQLTHGVAYQPEHGISRVLLVPSLVHRPWTLVLDHEQTRLFFYPARLEEELTAPDLALIGIYRALGDGTRLRILRRLAIGTATVARISEELGLAKSTVHEHLLSLRTAGLVRLPVAGGFELTPELPDLNWMLKEFLGLEMRRECETCSTPLEPDGGAYICSYECTFCQNCAESHNRKCPNCGGELVLRPRRSASPRPQRRTAKTRQSERTRSKWPRGHKSADAVREASVIRWFQA